MHDIFLFESGYAYSMLAVSVCQDVCMHVCLCVCVLCGVVRKGYGS